MRVLPSALLWLVMACDHRVDRKRLHATVADLAAAAAEMGMLLVQAERARLPHAYVDRQREALTGLARKATEELDRAVEDASLEPARGAALQLGRQLVDRMAAARTAHDLDGFAHRLETIATQTVP